VNAHTCQRRSRWWKGNRNRVFTAAVVISVMTAVSASAVLVPGVAGATGSCPTVAADGTVTPPPSPSVDWDGCDLTDGGTTTANLSNADLAGADLANANLTGANLTNADLNSTDLSGTILDGADLYGVISGEITGTPASLPVYWTLLYGYLVGAGADLEGATSWKRI
jgi:uncharacterized protein YjbI with pentapeptide repeats